MNLMDSLPAGYRAVVAGSSGGIGAAALELLASDPNCGHVTGLSRSSKLAIEFSDENSIAEAADAAAADGEIHLLFCATGFLSDALSQPEKSLRDLNPDNLARLFAINAIGPALLFKHFSPLLARRERSILATLSARVGSISDNRLGGWHSYRASKAALNMLVKGAAIELARNRPLSVCVGLHPGTVGTNLSLPFAKGKNVLPPSQSARDLLGVLNALSPADTGDLFAYTGTRIPW